VSLFGAGSTNLPAVLPSKLYGLTQRQTEVCFTCFIDTLWRILQAIGDLDLRIVSTPAFRMLVAYEELVGPKYSGKNAGGLKRTMTDPQTFKKVGRI